MIVNSFGNEGAENVIIQAIDKNSLSSIDDEIRVLHSLTAKDFYLMAVIVDDWFCDLSPWKAPAVFGNNPFGDDATVTLDFILRRCRDAGKNYYLGGYSLSGLFALWAAYQTDLFKGVAAASPSMWFPSFLTYMEEHAICCNSVYLSLGDREGKLKNKIMSTVDDCIKSAHNLLTSHDVNCILEWNQGNHFTDVEERCARSFAWILENA